MVPLPLHQLWQKKIRLRTGRSGLTGLRMGVQMGMGGEREREMGR